MTGRTDFSAKSRARRRALQGLYQWHINRQEAEEIANQFVSKQDFSTVDEAHFRLLLAGVVENEDTLLKQLTPALDRPLEQLDIMEKVVLLIGVFELLHCPQTPWRVVINECVDLSKRFGSEQGYAYINGVLDKVATGLHH